MKAHRFLVTVKTPLSRCAAHSALLLAFGCRKPDNCEFQLRHNGSGLAGVDARNQIRDLTKRNRTQARRIARLLTLAYKMTATEVARATKS